MICCFAITLYTCAIASVSGFPLDDQEETKIPYYSDDYIWRPLSTDWITSGAHATSNFPEGSTGQTGDVIEQQVLQRKAREAPKDSYDWYYDEEYLDYDEDKGKESMLERYNARAKYLTIAGSWALGVLLCCVCCIISVLREFCFQLCIVLRRTICQFWDAVRCRDPEYRYVEDACMKINVPPPTYSQYIMIKEAAGHKQKRGLMPTLEA